MLRYLLAPIAWLMAFLEPQVAEIRKARMLRRSRHTGDVTLRDNVILSHPEKISFGRNVLVNHMTHIAGGGGVEIGDNVVIGAGVLILTTNHKEPVFFGNIQYQPVVIGNNVWIGAGAIVLPGCRIADNVVIAAGAVASGPLTESGIYVGVPARWTRPLKPGE